ncbi:MAG: hypothetical protein HYU66_29680 [Armatimonadetes bacterium]|nr:hypothetical protein [Armatimonadota bacterium]
MTLADSLGCPVLPDPPPDLLRDGEGPVLLLGNLADSRCVRELHHHFLCVTDRWYPGPGGYELRTLPAPFGGNDVVHLGYSDDVGLGAGTARLLELLDDPLPPLAEVHATRFPLSDAERDAIEHGAYPDQAWQIANSCLGDQKGYLGYLSGDGGLARQWAAAWEAILDCGIERTERIVQTHLFMLSRISVWRLLEAVGLVPDHLADAIPRYVLEWAESHEGWRHIDVPTYQSPHYPRQNHGLVPALALVMAGHWFATHHPEVTGPEQWRKVANAVFAPYVSSWKPLCDGLCHGWWMSQPVILEYALFDAEHRYFEGDGARTAAEGALAIVNNQGWMPSAGDADLDRQFPGPSLRAAAYWYGDGRYEYAHRRGHPNRVWKWLGAMSPPRAYDIGIAPVEPAGGLAVVPCDPLLYNVWELDPRGAPGVTDGPPTAPIERCFDKLAIRAGWQPDDTYLILDGIGGGSHSYADAASILDFARYGVSGIVCEDNFVWAAPEDHSTVTVTRDGVMGTVPAFAELECAEQRGDGSVYVRLKLAGYAGADWVREVDWQPGSTVRFTDTVTAREPGLYAVEAHFRTPAEAAIEGRGLVSLRRSESAGPVTFRIESDSPPEALRLSRVPIELRYRNLQETWEYTPPANEPENLWRERYQTGGIALTVFTARRTARLAAGESVSLVHEAWFELGHRPLAVATAAGGEQSEQPWRDLEGPVHAVARVEDDPPWLVVGHAAAQLSAIDLDGSLRWTHRIERDPCPWPWWELRTPAPVAVAAGRFREGVRIAVGCGDIQLRVFDEHGAEQWRYRYNEGVPGRVVIADVDGDGEPEIVMGGEVLSDTSCCRILTADRRLMAELYVEGWTSRLTALAWAVVDGRALLACGASRGRNLRVFDLTPLRDGGRAAELFMHQLGGAVTGLAFVDDGLRVTTSMGFELVYGLDGERRSVKLRT